MLFQGQSEWDYFLFRRNYDYGDDESDFVPEFYTIGCTTNEGYTYISAYLKRTSVSFSMDTVRVLIHLPEMSDAALNELRVTLDTAISIIGQFIDHSKYT